MFSVNKMGRRRPRKSEIRIWKVWEAPRLLCIDFKAGTPLMAAGPNRHTLKGYRTSVHVPGFSRPTGTFPHAFDHWIWKMKSFSQLWGKGSLSFCTNNGIRAVK